MYSLNKPPEAERRLDFRKMSLYIFLRFSLMPLKSERQISGCQWEREKERGNTREGG